jgi:hypothetical protein
MLYVLTFGRWGLVIIDSFREPFIASQMLEGAVLYKDLAYLFGPFIPCLYAVLFSLFGVNLIPLYLINGLMTLLYSLILYYLSRQILSIKSSVVVVLLFFFVCAFFPTLKNYIFTYTASASYGSFFAIATLACFVYHFKSQKNNILYFAALLSALTFLTKHEFAVAVSLLWLFYLIFSRFFISTSLKIYILPIILFAAIAVIPYWLFIVPAGYSNILAIVMPVEAINSLEHYHHYFIRSGITLESVTAGVFFFAFFAFISSAVILLAYFYQIYRQKSLYLPLVITTLALMAFCGWLYLSPGAARIVAAFTGQNFMKFFAGTNFIILIVAIISYRKLRGDIKHKILFLYCIFSIFISLRSPLFLSLETYGIYYLPVGLIILIYFFKKIIPEWLKSYFNTQKLHQSVNVLFFLIICFFLFTSTGLYIKKSYQLKYGDRGFIMVENSLGKYLESVLTFLRSNTVEGQVIYVIPEESFYYYFTKTRSPSRYFYTDAAWFKGNKSAECQLINDLTNRKPEYIIISNIKRNSYGIKAFGEDFCSDLNSWIHQNYSIEKIISTRFALNEDYYYQIFIYKPN